MAQNEHILLKVEARPGAVILRFADGQSLEVAPDAVPCGALEAGTSIDEPTMAYLREAAERKAAARRLLDMLARRLDSRQRLRFKLCEKGLSASAVDAVLDQAEARGLCSDRLFAAAYCRDVLRTRLVGRRWIEEKLRGKGVAAPLAATVAAEELALDRERELALQAASGRWKRERGRDDRALARVQRFLISRGFLPATANAAARQGRPSD
jgi:SOS response regulatory protein OraA/RecX